MVIVGKFECMVSAVSSIITGTVEYWEAGGVFVGCHGDDIRITAHYSDGIGAFLLVVFVSEKPSMLPPSLSIAASKLNFVLVGGSKNKEPKSIPCKLQSISSILFISSPLSMSSMYSSLVNIPGS